MLAFKLLKHVRRKHKRPHKQIQDQVSLTVWKRYIVKFSSRININQIGYSKKPFLDIKHTLIDKLQPFP